MSRAWWHREPGETRGEHAFNVGGLLAGNAINVATAASLLYQWEALARLLWLVLSIIEGGCACPWRS